MGFKIKNNTKKTKIVLLSRRGGGGIGATLWFGQLVSHSSLGITSIFPAHVIASPERDLDVSAEEAQMWPNTCKT